MVERLKKICRVMIAVLPNCKNGFAHSKAALQQVEGRPTLV
jgi:hypothetical protein